jgi:hypothetical protein
VGDEYNVCWCAAAGAMTTDRLAMAADLVKSGDGLKEQARRRLGWSHSWCHRHFRIVASRGMLDILMSAAALDRDLSPSARLGVSKTLGQLVILLDHGPASMPRTTVVDSRHRSLCNSSERWAICMAAHDH